MARFTHISFASLTFGPILFWLFAIAVVLSLSGLADCRIDEAGAYPCHVMGIDVGNMAANLGLFAAWGPLIFGPFVVGAGILWALVAIVRRLLHRKR